MSRWFRVYDDLVDDPKVQRLEPNLFKALINLWCLASQGKGILPTFSDIAFKLRIDEATAIEIVDILERRQLLNRTNGKLSPHNWNGRQFKSDTDPTNAERQKRYRNSRRNGTVTELRPLRNALRKRPDTETDTE